MLAFIMTAFPTVAAWVNQVVAYFAARAKAQSDASAAADQEIAAHAHDGAQSVADRVSATAQNQALGEIAQQIDNPVTVTVTPPTEGNKK